VSKRSILFQGGRRLGPGQGKREGFAKPENEGWRSKGNVKVFGEGLRNREGEVVLAARCAGCVLRMESGGSRESPHRRRKKADENVVPHRRGKALNGALSA